MRSSAALPPHLLYSLKRIFCMSWLVAGACSLPLRPVYAQQRPVVLAEFNYAMGVPGGDLAQRFGSHLAIGGGVGFHPGKRKFHLGMRGSVFFGQTVKEDVIAPFRTSQYGLLIGADQLLAEMKLRERAWLLCLSGGGLIALRESPSSHAQLKWQLGLGFIEHSIRFVDDASALPQFDENLIQGLDRLSNGLAVVPAVGFEHLSKSGGFSYYAGVETILGFTRNQRSYHYDLGISELGKSRLDLMWQLRIALYLPFHLGDADDVEY